jgi:hypothetical protein
MKSGQNAPPATRTITTSPHQTPQDESHVREKREEEKPTQTSKPNKDSEDSHPWIYQRNKSSTSLMVRRNLPTLVHTMEEQKYSIALKG